MVSLLAGCWNGSSRTAQHTSDHKEEKKSPQEQYNSTLGHFEFESNK